MALVQDGQKAGTARNAQTARTTARAARTAKTTQTTRTAQAARTVQSGARTTRAASAARTVRGGAQMTSSARAQSAQARTARTMQITQTVPVTKASSKNEKKSRKPKKEKERRGLLRGLGRGMKLALLSVFALLLAAVLAVGIGFYVKYGKQLLSYQSKANTLVRRSTEETFKASQTSLVYAADGDLISRLKGEKDVYYINYEDIPEYAVQAMICTEDRKFFEHDGIDLFANIRAAIVLIKNKGEIHQGGSTITQQLSRAIFLSNEVTWERKITEIFVAMALEKKYSKKQIMEFYLNNIYFANGYYGIQAASVGYFSKGVKELSLSQVAFLCAIPNNPTDYDPVTNFQYTMLRRDKVLEQMRDEGAITRTQYQQAVEEKIVLNRSKKEIQDYAESYTYYCAIRALMAREGFVFRNAFLNDEDRKSYDEQYYEAYYRIQKTLFTGGYRIYTSIDLKKQKLLQQAVDEELAGFTDVNEAGTYKLQSSAVCIDNRTGRVVAIIGGRSQEKEGYTLNRAYQSFRQPGSAIKPLIVYTPMFERGMYPDDIVLDERFEGGPRNSGNVYSGEISVSYAIAVSKNTVAWKLFEELTPRVGLSYLLKMGFRRIVDTDYVPAVSLGGFTYGVSAVELASGFAALCNDGTYREPTCIVKITDVEGNVLIGDAVRSEKVYATNAARMMTACMQDVMETGTGRRLKINGQIAAGKTGTTTDQKDGWFAGFTAYYTTAVWVGCDMPQAMDDLMGNTYPGRIWQAFMNQVHDGLAPKEFVMYTDIRPPKEDEEEDVEETGDEGEDGEGGEDIEDRREDGQEMENGGENGEDGEETEDREEDGKGGEETEDREVGVDTEKKGENGEDEKETEDSGAVGNREDGEEIEDRGENREDREETENRRENGEDGKEIENRGENREGRQETEGRRENGEDGEETEKREEDGEGGEETEDEGDLEEKEDRREDEENEEETENEGFNF